MYREVRNVIIFGRCIMFNYTNINDVEFENLCRDIMSRELGLDLRTYASGSDGGIDIADLNSPHEVIIQVKHYIKSSVPTLINNLKKEVQKVKERSPTKYYLCIAKELTPGKIEEIYNLFRNYMESTKNIYTLKEIDAFLQKDENADIVRNHYKLWLESTNILNNLLHNSLFIDCETLLAGIEEDRKLFVETEVLRKSESYLKKNRILMMMGPPGIGKTTTSKMLLLRLVSEGFQARYSSNSDIKGIKNVISSDKDKKEVILLDDVLGQHYFRMSEGRENELIALIDYVKMNPNKILIMNTRVTIYNEARNRSQNFGRMTSKKRTDYTEYIIDFAELSMVDKAMIFYNHLYFNEVSDKNIAEIKKNKNYRRIVEYPNYSPRIIEYVTEERDRSSDEFDSYYNYVIRKLDYPDGIWGNEFNRRIEDVDRIMLLILYSLTDTTIDYDVLKSSFNRRISKIDSLDSSVNQFNQSLERLNKSMISVFDKNGKKEVGVLNPSINDFLRNEFKTNTVELERIKDSIYHYRQLESCYTSDEIKSVVNLMIANKSILSLKFDNVFERLSFIALNVIDKLYLDKDYEIIITDFLKMIEMSASFIRQHTLSYSNLFDKLLFTNLYEYYNIETLMGDFNQFNKVLSGIPLDKISDVLKIVEEKIKTKELIESVSLDECRAMFNDAVMNSLTKWLDELVYSDFINDEEIFEIVEANLKKDSRGDYYFDESGIENKAFEIILEDLIGSVDTYLYQLDFLDFESIETYIADYSYSYIDFNDMLNIYSEIIKNEQLMEQEYGGKESTNGMSDSEKIDQIFNR